MISVQAATEGIRANPCLDDSIAPDSGNWAGTDIRVNSSRNGSYRPYGSESRRSAFNLLPVLIGS
jgi:hypothetical protein